MEAKSKCKKSPDGYHRIDCDVGETDPIPCVYCGEI